MLGMKRRESYIEKKVVAIARKNNWLSYKWVSPSQKWVPDRLFFKDGVLIIVEFKAPKKKPTKGQKLIHEALAHVGFPVHTVDSVSTGEKLFSENPLKECCPSEDTTESFLFPS
jgi:hypothetical protein